MRVARALLRSGSNVGSYDRIKDDLTTELR